jgi:hypothetical protein
VDLLRGAIDIHVHSHPDIRPRKLDDLQLVEEARRAGMRAVLLKSHVFSTAERAYLLNRVYPDFQSFGGIALNTTVGGFNAAAVAAALTMGAKQVWMPTVSAANHARRAGGGGTLRVSADGRTIRPEVVEILELVAEHGAILGTGHLAPDESALLIPRALILGVRWVVVTHPEWEYTAVPVVLQRRWAETGQVLLERCLVSTWPSLGGSVPFETITHQIRQVGVESTVISTDYGLEVYPSPLEGMRRYLHLLLDAGFTEGEVAIMAQDNPARLLGLGKRNP